MHRAPMLRVALGANAAFSAASGTILALLPHAAGAFLGIALDEAVRAVGIALLAYAGMLVSLAVVSKAPMLLAACASLADFAWVAATVSVAVFAPGLFSATGWWAVGGVAVLVAAFGMAQAVGIDRAFRHPDPNRRGWSRICVVVGADAPARDVWSAVRDAGAIHRYAPFLSASTVVGEPSGAGLPVRECRDRGGRCWREEILADDEQRVMELRFQADRPGFPFPFRQMVGGWQIEDRGEGSRVLVWWDVVPKVRPLSFLLLPAFLASARRAFPVVVANMCESDSGQARPSATRAGRLRRLAGVC